MLQHDCVHLATREQDKNISFNANLNEGDTIQVLGKDKHLF